MTSKETIDVVLAAKAILDRDLRLGLVKEEDLELRFTQEARKRAAPILSDNGFSNRQIAKVTGFSPKTIDRDIAASNDAKNASNDAPLIETIEKKIAAKDLSTRERLSQSDQNDWRTPRKFLDAAREVMGAIDLDPATSAEANETVQASTFYTEADNGLQKPWKGRVWLNPPYGGEARLFVERLIREYEVGNVTAACALVNSHPTETKWFQPLFDYAVCFVQGRIDFGGPSRPVSTTSTHGSAIAYFGKDIAAFAKRFSEFGAVVRRVDR